MLRTAVLQTPTYLTILSGLLLIGYQYWIGPLPIEAQFIVCILFLVASGIPHGALDHIIEQERSSRSDQPFSMVVFIINYLLMIAAYGIGWLFFPVLSLLLFLVISAWHFGETDLENAPPTMYWALARFLAGGWVLAFILLTHIPETAPILARILQGDSRAMYVWSGIASQGAKVLYGYGTVGLAMVILAHKHRSTPINGWRLTRLSMVLLLAYYLPLLPAFMLYFCGWHALSSFGTIRAYLGLPAYSLRSAWRLWWLALPLTIAAFVFLGVCTALWSTYVPTLDPIPCLFILLSTITLPHIRIMHRLYLLDK